MSDKVEAPIQTVQLRTDERINLKHLLPDNASGVEQSQAVGRLRRRLDPGDELLEDRTARRHRDGMIELNGQTSESEVELTDNEVSLIAKGVEQLEQIEEVPTSEPFLQLYDKIEPLIETTRNRGED